MGTTMPHKPERAIAFIATDMDGQARIIDVLRGGAGFEFRTENGEQVTVVRRGHYLINGTDYVLVSNDPRAV
jgi:hypothetical protein